MIRYVVTYERYLTDKRPGLTKLERVYFESWKEAEDWMVVFSQIAKNCCNFFIEELPYMG